MEEETKTVLVNTNVLHEFFNSRSDANKYLEANQQEELETQFEQYISEK